ncbi:heme/hemin ABC transporter substrate-binding protein [Aquamicrobium ahrensii]|uniref:Iron complex transport system substrate-binding protein n=1 Tax=Aquamicrobium ahrensii TaxID=469551 RepID=A0ABV2KGL4_9HYPH
MTIFSRFASRAAMLFCLAAAPFSAQADETNGKFDDPSRIAAIGGSITEIVFALGEGDRLIARDTTSVFPPEAMELPDVGYMRQLSPEGVLSVSPGGILALEGSGPKETVDVLKKASVPYIEVPERFDHEGILAKIHAVGEALGVGRKADALAGEVDAKLKEAEARTKDVTERKRVLFILSMQGGKVMASGVDTAANGVIRLAGAVNAIEGYSGYKQLTEEAIVEAHPDVILMMSRAGGHAANDDEILSHPAIATTPAGKAGRIVRMDGAYMLGFGPRTADAVRDVAVALYGDQAAD